MFFNNKFNTFVGLNLSLVYTSPMCMAWRFHFPIRKYDFKYYTGMDKRVWDTSSGSLFVRDSGCPRHVGRNYVPLLCGVDTDLGYYVIRDEIVI